MENLLFIDDLVIQGDAHFDKGYIVFTNGVLNLETMKLIPWTPTLFLSSGLPFFYVPGEGCAKFLSYLNDFCMGERDRIQFMRSFMSVILHQRTDFQVCLYMFGPGGSGKSTIANIFCALVGDKKVISTTLKALNTDPFEIVNLVGKKLVLISD